MLGNWAAATCCHMAESGMFASGARSSCVRRPLLPCSWGNEAVSHWAQHPTGLLKKHRLGLLLPLCWFPCFRDHGATAHRSHSLKMGSSSLSGPFCDKRPMTSDQKSQFFILYSSNYNIHFCKVVILIVILLRMLSGIIQNWEIWRIIFPSILNVRTSITCLLYTSPSPRD